LILFSCSGVVSKRNADIEVKYEGVTVYSKSATWSTREEVFNALERETGPLYIIFGADWCKSCSHLIKIAKKEGWDEKIIFLNVDYPWVGSTALKMGVKQVPILIVVSNKGKITNKIVLGTPAIVTYLVSRVF